MSYLAQQQTSPVELINTTLKGSVVDTLRLYLPDLAPYSNEEAFNVILNSPEMAQRSFGVFREHPDAFAGVLRGPENQLVANDDEPLSCGRTLAQVVALVVQAVAKRYFRAKLLRRGAPAAVAEPGLIEKVTQLFTGPKAPEPAAKPTTSHADRLFLAMRDHLLFEWQLRLIPHYVGLPVSLVQALGARLLEFREIEDIQWMVRHGEPLLEPTTRRADPAPVPTAEEPTAAAVEIMDQVEPDIARSSALPEGVTAQRYVGAVLAKVNSPLARWLAGETRLNPRQLALMLIRAYESLPASDFQRFGASLPASDEARRFLGAAKAARFGADTSPAVAAEFARLYQARIKALL